MLSFRWLDFYELSPYQLYSILQLRAKIFIVEQNCAYLDLDGKDLSSMHLLGIQSDKIVTYLRLLPADLNNKIVHFGRVLTAPEYRKQGIANQLLQQLLDYCYQHYPHFEIHCSAQYYLKNFYQTFGFVPLSDPYEEDGISHIAMKRNYSL